MDEPSDGVSRSAHDAIRAAGEVPEPPDRVGPRARAMTAIKPRARRLVGRLVAFAAAAALTTRAGILVASSEDAPAPLTQPAVSVETPDHKGQESGNGPIGDEPRAPVCDGGEDRSQIDDDQGADADNVEKGSEHSGGDADQGDDAGSEQGDSGSEQGDDSDSGDENPADEDSGEEEEPEMPGSDPEDQGSTAETGDD